MRNPTRRNRNIGTAKSGYSKDNKLVVPSKWADYKVFWERLSDPVMYPISINNHEITMFVEPVRDGYVHASTPADIVSVLKLIPQEHLEEIEVIVLRQPKKKEEILRPVWGRFVYYADFGRYSGAGVYLEAVKKNAVISWNKKLSPFDQKELKALEEDGHVAKATKRGFEIHTTPQTVRNAQLFRTLPHEIGHAIDFLKNSLEPMIEADSEEEEDYISNVFDSKPTLDKEEYANRYARDFKQKWSDKRCIPFDRAFDEDSLSCAGFDPKWFEY